LLFFISIYKGELEFPVHLISSTHVRISLPFDPRPLDLHREGDTWAISGRTSTTARLAIVRAWDAVSKSRAHIIEEIGMKTESDSYVFMVD
jgi:hypothetical protein